MIDLGWIKFIFATLLGGLSSFFALKVAIKELKKEIEPLLKGDVIARIVKLEEGQKATSDDTKEIKRITESNNKTLIRLESFIKHKLGEDL